ATPVQGEPSRRMARLHNVGLISEITGVDRLQAWFVDRKACQRAVCCDHGARGVCPYVAICGQPIEFRPAYDIADTRDGAKSCFDAFPGGLDFDGEAATEDLAGKFTHGSEKRDTALPEQRN